MFIDSTKLYLKAGNGGNGCVAFHREKYVSAGGPVGGDGGKGGDVFFVTDKNLHTLEHLRYTHHMSARNGEDGKGEKMYGKSAEDLVIKVPVGTLIKDAESGKVIKDLSDEEPFILCKGGRGGWGNRHFATPTRQTPMFAKSGTKGEEREVILELKMIADVGLIGFPNVGKSSLLSRISAAKPKIANYHFTTLSPMLGVVSTGGEGGFVAADIPGLIEGAAEGAGLGHAFLRHVERCRLLLHVVDVSGSEGRNPIEDIEKINDELLRYSPELSSRPQIVVANKADMLDSSDTDIEEFENYIDEKGYELLYVSAVTGENLDNLIHTVAERLKLLPPITVYDSEVESEEAVVVSGRNTVIRRENNTFYVEGEWLYNLVGQVNFEDYESLNFFQKALINGGVIKMLEEKGCSDGDTVNIYDFEFDFVK